jgi:hypothetical protein
MKAVKISTDLPPSGLGQNIPFQIQNAGNKTRSFAKPFEQGVNFFKINYV